MLNIINTKKILGLTTSTGWNVIMFEQTSWHYHIRLEHVGYERDLKLSRNKNNSRGYTLEYGSYKMYMDKGKMFSPEVMLNNIERLIG